MGKLALMAGTLCGIYIAQNYKVPDVKKLASTALSMARLIHHNYSKPTNSDE